MQARKSLFSFVLVVAALAGLASSAPSRADDVAQDKAGAPSAMAPAVAESGSNAGAKPETAAALANSAPILAATDKGAEAATASSSADAKHTEQNADGAPTSKTASNGAADKTDLATQTTQLNSDTPGQPGGPPKKRSEPAGSVPDVKKESVETSQPNAETTGQPPDASHATHDNPHKKRSQAAESANDTGKKDANTDTQPGHKDSSQTVQEAQQLNANPAASTGSGTDSADAAGH